jgi:uncharacterized protein DUF4158
MVKAYAVPTSYSHEEMVEHFLLTPAELQLVLTCRGNANRCGMALLQKTISHLGYVPDPMPQIPEEVRAFVAAQLGLLWDSSEAYSWHGSTLDFHLAQIRQHSGWRFPTAQDKEELETGFATRTRKRRTRRTPFLIPHASACGVCGWNCRRKANSNVSSTPR